MGVDIKDLLHLMLVADASDLHLKAGASPVLRIHGRLVAYTQMAPLAPEDTEGLFLSMASEE